MVLFNYLSLNRQLINYNYQDYLNYIVKLQVSIHHSMC